MRLTSPPIPGEETEGNGGDHNSQTGMAYELSTSCDIVCVAATLAVAGTSSNDNDENLHLADSKKLKSTLDDAEARIRATGGIKHEDFWNQLDGEYQDFVTEP